VLHAERIVTRRKIGRNVCYALADPLALVVGAQVADRLGLPDEEPPPARLGAGLTVFVEVSLDKQGAEHIAAFEARALQEAAVQQCHRVSPGPDLMLVMQVPDMAAYHALVQRLFTQDANVRNVKAFFSVHRAKFETAISLPTLAG